MKQFGFPKPMNCYESEFSIEREQNDWKKKEMCVCVCMYGFIRVAYSCGQKVQQWLSSKGQSKDLVGAQP